MDSSNPNELNEALLSMAMYERLDPVRYQKFNKAQVRFLRALKDPPADRLCIVLFLKPNRIGGSRVMMAALSSIIFGTDHPDLQCAPFGDRWPYKIRSARLISTAETLGDVGPLQGAIRDLFPDGKYTQSRGVGKSYNSALKTTDSGWEVDMMTFGQDALSAAGSTKGLILVSEPIPKPLYVECLTRLSGSGLLAIECTQLDLAPYLEEMAEEAGGKIIDGVQYGKLRLDGKEVGEIRVVRGDIHDACLECNDGHMAHSAIEATIAAWPIEEREARKTGKPLKLSGRILPTWGDQNEIAEPSEWHREMWSKGMVRIATVLDPADARPWAMAWFAIYPNEDVIAFQEWPPFSFSECKQSPVRGPEEYRSVILESEAQIRVPGQKPGHVDIRLIDPLFGAAPGKSEAMGIKQMLARPCRECFRRVGREDHYDTDERSQAYIDAARNCKHRLVYSPSLAYNGSVRDGHILLREWIGGGVPGTDGYRRPKAMAMREMCPNMCRGMRGYAYKLSKDPDRAHVERPEMIHKDYPDLWRLGMLKGFYKWPREEEPMPMPMPGPRKLFLPPGFRPDRPGYMDKGGGR